MTSNRNCALYTLVYTFDHDKGICITIDCKGGGLKVFAHIFKVLIEFDKSSARVSWGVR